MAKNSLNGVLTHIRRLASVQTRRGQSDRELIERFLADNDEAAFTVLVERHGAMVLGVCRRALANVHDAEDACQATFLVLARKARSIRKRPSLSSWLHGVACRVALNLKRERSRRQRREHATTRPAPVDPGAEVTWREAQALLDQELLELPERYRAALVLCYLDGKTRDEAAKLLGITTGGLHGRLERGRKLLRDRLTRRGLTLSAALFASALSAGAVQAAVSPTVVVSLSKAAFALAGGQPLASGIVSANVLSLTQEVLKTMFLTKVKIATSVVLCTGLLMTLIGGTMTSTTMAQAPKADWRYTAPKAPQGPKTESDEEFIRRTSLDLRGTLPTPTEMHFFLANKDAGKRQKLIDLLIQERQAKKDRETLVKLWKTRVDVLDEWVYVAPRFAAIQGDFHKELLAAATTRKELATIAQSYLDRLIKYLKDHPKNDDVPDAMAQIVMVYSSQNKTVEADAWRYKLQAEHPNSPAARSLRDSDSMIRLWRSLLIEYDDPGKSDKPKKK
jgi:RNA polymerase sigma factor (sigma-70 family)